jgi:hypothetical protein
MGSAILPYSTMLKKDKNIKLNSINTEGGVTVSVNAQVYKPVKGVINAASIKGG